MGKCCAGKILQVFVAAFITVTSMQTMAFGQAATTPAGVPPAQTTPEPATQKESLPIGPGDQLHITFFDEPNLEQRVRVNDAGDVELSLIGRIHVGGLTPIQASAAIAQRYKQGGFLNNPQVQIFVEQYATENVSILGQVKLPGPVALPTPRNILDVLALAGGLTDVAERNIVIQRTNGEKVNVFVPNEANITLQAATIMVNPGDIVYVPRAPIVYVLGDVGKPGGYVSQDNSKMTVLQALAMAGGANKTASETSARLLRHESSGMVVQKIDLKKMQTGKIPDIAMENDDILWMGFNYGKNILVNLPNIISAASSAAIYQASNF